ncbi:hypothetical protein KRX51_01305 [Corynebacterium sp. TAE3-ERU12]|uniref:hypothetical protein n=1 Tax=Corynebacterium sp. TAE3-ERU12 TaxID=2849491 RepID=UPI001C446414|nr:hypothetical protein [Corynebacterium sp. TAE3-ERU12]MBV7294556.1 hypothetical protein [Corynebacterium sp. TAE3-ERU12]
MGRIGALAAFLISVGVLFTLMAPGGLGEPTIGLGVILALAGLFPESWVVGLAHPIARRLSIGLLLVGSVMALLDWGLDLSTVADVAATLLFYGGFLVLLLHAVAYWRVHGDQLTS